MAESDDPYRPLFASDLAQDVRSEFYEHVGHGFSASTASAHVFDRFQSLLVDPDDGPVVFVCLAALQMAQHELNTVVRDAAIDLIESNEALHAWQKSDSTTSSKHDRKMLLMKLGDELRAAAVIDETGGGTADDDDATPDDRDAP